MATNKQKSKALYGISRVDDDVYRKHAWRVSLRRRGERYVKDFPDKKHGGKRKALNCAKAYRDELLAAHPPLSRREFAAAPRRHNRSGITGVYRYAKSYTLQDGSIKQNWFWEAHWPTSRGKSAKQTFAIDEFGEDRARELAIRARRRGLAKIEGVFWASDR